MTQLQVQSRECLQSQSQNEKVLNFARLEFTNISWSTEDLLISRDTKAGPSHCQPNTTRFITFSDDDISHSPILLSSRTDLELSATSFCWTARRSRWCWTPPTTRPSRSSASMSWRMVEEEERQWPLSVTAQTRDPVSVFAVTPGQINYNCIIQVIVLYFTFPFSLELLGLTQNMTKIIHNLECEEETEEEVREEAVTLLSNGSVLVTRTVLPHPGRISSILIGRTPTLLRSHWSSVEIFSCTERSYYRRS